MPNLFSGSLKLFTHMTDHTTLFALFISAFTSATLLPGTSDVALSALIWQQPKIAYLALIVATIGNTLGAMVSYGMGKMLPEKTQQKLSTKTLARLQRYGTPLLLFSWVPIIGDTLPLAAGWLRLPFWQSALFITLGKAARYAVLMYATLALK